MIGDQNGDTSLAIDLKMPINIPSLLAFCFKRLTNTAYYKEAMTSSQSILSNLASFFSRSPPPRPPETEIAESSNECIEVAMSSNDVPPNNTTPSHLSSPIDGTTNDNTTPVNSKMSVEEGVSVVRHTTPSIEISQDCAYDMSKIKIDYISQPTTTASDSWEGEDNDGHNPTSSKRREIFGYLQSKLSKIDKRRRILIVHLLMLLVIGLVLVIVIVSTTSVSVKSKDQRQSTSGKFIYTCFHMLCLRCRVMYLIAMWNLQA